MNEKIYYIRNKEILILDFWYYSCLRSPSGKFYIEVSTCYFAHFWWVPWWPCWYSLAALILNLCSIFHTFFTFSYSYNFCSKISHRNTLWILEKSKMLILYLILILMRKKSIFLRLFEISRKNCMNKLYCHREGSTRNVLHIILSPNTKKLSRTTNPRRNRKPDNPL